MSFLGQIDMELQKDLVAFIQEQEAKPYPHVLGESLMNEILKDIIKGDARISGCATNHKTKKMYLEVSFYEKREEENADGVV